MEINSNNHGDHFKTHGDHSQITVQLIRPKKEDTMLNEITLNSQCRAWRSHAETRRAGAPEKYPQPGGTPGAERRARRLATFGGNYQGRSTLSVLTSLALVVIGCAGLAITLLIVLMLKVWGL